MGVKVLVSDNIAAEGMERLRADAAVEVVDGGGWSRDELLDRIADFDGLIVRSATQVDEELIQRATRLKVVGRAGVGVDNIDVDAATKRGIVVINSPEGNTVSAAEHTIAMMTAMARSIPQAHVSLVKNGQWERKKYLGVQLAGKTLGVLGLGRIGSEVVRRALGLDMKVIAYDPFVNEERAKKLGVTLASVEDICRVADFITVHTPLTKQTEGLLSAAEFALMKPGVRIVNCARGGIIDENALYDAIKSGRVAGAALDVFVDEPPLGHPLLTLEQVIATPHLGASTLEAQINVAIDTAESVLLALRGQPVPNAVNAPALRFGADEDLQPYLLLAERLGHFFTCVFGGNFERLEVVCKGEATRLDDEALTAAFFKGMLSPILHEGVNYINSRALAEERQIRLALTKEATAGSAVDRLRVRAWDGDRERSACGSVNLQGEPIIVEIDGYPVNVATEGRLLLAYNVDRPGIIGRVGTLLGECGINIAFMQVGRKKIGGYAVMVLGIDASLDDDVLKRIQAMEDLKDVRLVEW